ncbi:MAG: hypothetical protein ACRD0K_26205 [Egibacteraceae bacterium]
MKQRKLRTVLSLTILAALMALGSASAAFATSPPDNDTAFGGGGNGGTGEDGGAGGAVADCDIASADPNDCFAPLTLLGL